MRIQVLSNHLQTVIVKLQAISVYNAALGDLRSGTAKDVPPVRRGAGRFPRDSVYHGSFQSRGKELSRLVGPTTEPLPSHPVQAHQW